jgi:hypothetical protein
MPTNPWLTTYSKVFNKNILSYEHRIPPFCKQEAYVSACSIICLPYCTPIDTPATPFYLTQGQEALAAERGVYSSPPALPPSGLVTASPALRPAPTPLASLAGSIPQAQATGVEMVALPATRAQPSALPFTGTSTAGAKAAAAANPYHGLGV